MYRARNTHTRHNCQLLFEFADGVEFVVFDTETTGIDPDKDYIVELAAKKYVIREKAMEYTETLDLYIRPPFRMDDKVVEIHHITNEMLEEKPTEEQLLPDIVSFFGDRPIVVGKNVMFDVGMLKSLYRRCGQEFTPQVAIDIGDMVYDLIDRSEVGDYQLHTLAEMYGLDDGLTFHNALDDVEATARLLYCFYLEYKKLPEETGGKKKIYVNTMYFWKGNNSNQQGIWLKTNLDEEGRIFYSTKNKAWYSSKINLKEYNIDEMEQYCLKKTGLSLAEFGRLTEKKFKNLRKKRREEGVYL